VPLLSGGDIPPIISRSEWGAREPDHQAPNEFGFATSPLKPQWYVYPESLTDAYNTVVIHHSASLLAVNETMTDIQDSHMDVNGWADIAYHYGIDKDGLVYEGRDIGARGASVAGFNTGTIGIVVMGNFEQEHPLDVQMKSLQALVNNLTSIYSLSHLAGHGEFNPESVCPGSHFIPYLDELAQNAGLLRGTAGHVRPTV
jgi:N-acetylmuramoyl-L-alanine amidase